MKPIRIVLADEHRSVRDGLALLLQTQRGFRVVGAGGTAAEVLAIVRQTRPQVVIAETRLPDRQGPDFLRRLRRIDPRIKLVAFTSQDDPETLETMFAARASGYVLKRSSSAELFGAIRAVQAGEIYCDPIMAGQALTHQANRQEADTVAGRMPLSEQQTQVLRLVAWGYANKEIGERLQISVKTVETYRTRLQRKLNIKSRPELVLFALKRGWLRAP